MYLYWWGSMMMFLTLSISSSCSPEFSYQIVLSNTDGVESLFRRTEVGFLQIL